MTIPIETKAIPSQITIETIPYNSLKTRWQSPLKLDHTVDGSEILHQLRLVDEIPLFTRGF